VSDSQSLKREREGEGERYIVQKLVGFSLTPGLPTTVLVVTFFAGVQLLSLGLIVEYVGRI
jgi:polyisoprenyl-phosphate glycosyltransferase